MTPARLIARSPSGEAWRRWSADVARSSAASAAAPTSASSSAWSLIPRPDSRARRRIRRDSSTVKTPRSQKTSQNRARRSFAIAGIMRSVRSDT